MFLKEVFHSLRVCRSFESVLSVDSNHYLNIQGNRFHSFQQCFRNINLDFEKKVFVMYFLNNKWRSILTRKFTI